MALTDLDVYNQFAYDAYTEVLAQQIDLFNAASANTIILRSTRDNIGDYDDRSYFAKISGLVRRRNPYGTGAVTAVSLSHLQETMVKIAAGTPPVEMNPSQFAWIKQNPEVAGAAMGQQLAVDTMADMLNTAIGATAAALQNVSAVVNDISAASPGTPSPIALNDTSRKFGDAGANIAAWIVHSNSMYNLWGNALTNTEQLFLWGAVAIRSDPFGRRFVMSDIPGLVVAGSPTKYRTLGLVSGAVLIEQNDDYTENWSTLNGDENILRTFQAEWSYELGIKGFTYDKSSGGHAPNDAAIFTAANWDKIATSNKDIAGVVLYSK